MQTEGVTPLSRLDIKNPSRAQTVVDNLYRDVERRIAASPPGLCPVDMSLSFLQLCHAQSCGKCVPCRIGLGQLTKLISQVLDGTANMGTVRIIEKTARKVGGYSYSTVSGRPNGTWHTEVGYGLIDAYAAVMEAQNASTTVYFNDKTVTTNTVVSGSEISATNVTVKNNAKLTFTNAKSIIITQPFTVELTSSLELSLQ